MRSQAVAVRTGWRWDPATQPKLLPGQEWWTDNPHRLASRLRADRTVRELGRWELAPGLHGAVVLRLKPRPTWRTRAPLWASLGALGLALGVTLVWAVWTAVGLLVAAAPTLLGGAAVVWVLVRLAGGHRGGCVGLHCPGCRG